MGHTKPDDLGDLANELREIRLLPGLKEKSVGVFYLKSTPFMHFHDKDGERWADVKKTDGGWLRIDVDFKASVTVKKKFLKTVTTAFEQLNAAEQSLLRR